MTTNVVDRFLAGLLDPAAQTTDVYTDDAVLDATVPDWRFRRYGPHGFAAQVAHWYRDPAEFEELVRVPIPGGELVEMTLAWTENGVPHAAHQVHRIEVEDGRIARDTMFCGGRFAAPRLAEMAAADERVKTADAGA